MRPSKDAVETSHAQCSLLCGSFVTEYRQKSDMNRDAQVSQGPALPKPLQMPSPIVPSCRSWQLLSRVRVHSRRHQGQPGPMLVVLYTQSHPLSHTTGLAVDALTGRFTPSKGWPIRRPRRPTRPYSCPPCLLRRQYQCRSGSGSPRRSPLAGPSAPSSRPPRIACAHLLSSSRGTAAEAVGAPEGRWQGNAGWWCAGTQSRGSSGCRAGTAEHRRRASGWAHHPTVRERLVWCVGEGAEQVRRIRCQCFNDLRVPSRSHRYGPSSRKSPRTPCS